MKTATHEAHKRNKKLQMKLRPNISSLPGKKNLSKLRSSRFNSSQAPPEETRGDKLQEKAERWES